jgi:KDO2-lipid IV(A) lauroyltransferase
MGKPRNPIWIRLSYGGFITAVFLVRHLPFRLALCLGDVFAALFFLLDGRHRNRVIRHLLHAGVAATPAAARALAWRNFRHFGRVTVEIATMRQVITPDNVRDHIRVGGDPEAVELFFTGRDGKPPSPAIIVTAHFGNWELAGLGYALLSGHSLTTIMRPLDNPLIGKWFYRQRQGFNHHIHEKSGALKPLLGALKRGESVCIIADQHAGHAEGVETVFFGHPARTHASPALLHLHTKVPILVAVPRRLPGAFQYEFTCAPPIRLTPSGDKDADVRRLAQAYTTTLENLIRLDPVQWLWAHRRWLDIHRKPSGT